MGADEQLRPGIALYGEAREVGPGTGDSILSPTCLCALVSMRWCRFQALSAHGRVRLGPCAGARVRVAVGVVQRTAGDLRHGKWKQQPPDYKSSNRSGIVISQRPRFPESSAFLLLRSWMRYPRSFVVMHLCARCWLSHWLSSVTPSTMPKPRTCLFLAHAP